MRDSLWIVAACCLAVLCTAGCGGGDTTDQSAQSEQVDVQEKSGSLATGPTEERWARSFDREQYGEWVPESTVKSTPPDGPAQIIWEVTRYADMDPTDEQLAAAADLRTRSRAAAEKNGWFDYDKGMKDGFVRQWNDENHYYKWDFITDEHLLDPERPEFLMYYPTEDGEQVLAGFMFLTSQKMEQGPQVAGPLVVWHYHLASHPHCFRDGMVLLGHPEGNRCLDGELSLRSPEMVHVWFIEHPEGRFATRMKLKPEMLRQALEEAKGMGCCSPGEE